MQMSSQPELLISAATLADLRLGGQLVIVDCRFDLSHPDKGRSDYLRSHVPGACYANLDHDLSSPVTPESGRHPLPRASEFSRFLANTGWTPGKLLVAYDDRNNAMASRLWWLMRYFGQDAALLDGGFEAWLNASLTTESGEAQRKPEQSVKLLPDEGMVVSANDVLQNLSNPHFTLLDARAPERFSGSVEPLDTRGGHIPGALNRPLGMNLDASGCFKSPGQLRTEFEALLPEAEPSSVVHSCGSGVTACHNQFAMELAGLGSSRVYPGSWSEWIRDRQRPIETVSD